MQFQVSTSLARRILAFAGDGDGYEWKPGRICECYILSQFDGRSLWTDRSTRHSDGVLEQDASRKLHLVCDCFEGWRSRSFPSINLRRYVAQLPCNAPFPSSVKGRTPPDLSGATRSHFGSFFTRSPRRRTTTVMVAEGAAVRTSSTCSQAEKRTSTQRTLQRRPSRRGSSRATLAR